MRFPSASSRDVKLLCSLSEVSLSPRAGEMQNQEAVLTNLDTLIRLNPRRVNVYLACAMIRESKGNAEGAIADYSKAIRIRPCEESLYCRRRELRLAVGEVAGAYADFLEMVRLAAAAPQSPASHASSRGVQPDCSGEFGCMSKRFNPNMRSGFRRFGDGWGWDRDSFRRGTL